ncbi:acyl carrier protein [Streptomyces triticirhizae]|uniref:Acyl carrier protein n=1 Tax=Streptomyces triticirhizae TaxID=2483353 RepID=A0A3M2LT24_9ACTN|nr:acyl carrier protein [Streptomyces triticirhizae]RMI40639.1 acyl carrier protein [Streptomyces triticirhizae]
MNQAVHHVTSTDAVGSIIARFVRVPFTDNSGLAEIGLDSMSLVRVVVAFLPDTGQEIDAAALAELRTVGELRGWLLSVAAAGGETP